MKKVSVIIPVYNSEKVLGRSLNSVCGQTIKEFEIICVNDCSTDRSLLILKQVEQKFKQRRGAEGSDFKIIDLKTNVGVSNARNAALEVAEGEYVAFVDSDDGVDTDFLEKLYTEAFRERADICKGETMVVTPDNKRELFLNNEQIRKSNSNLRFFGYFWTAIYKRSMLKDNAIKFEHSCSGCSEDLRFQFAATLKCGKMAFVDNAFYHYYKSKTSLSATYNHDKALMVYDNYDKITDTLNAQSATIDKNSLLYIYFTLVMDLLAIVNRVPDRKDQDFLSDGSSKIFAKCPYKDELTRLMLEKAKHTKKF